MANKMTVIIFSGDLDKNLAAFMLATTAGAANFETVLFFTFWGLNTIRKKKKVSRAQGLKRKLLGLLNRGGAGRLRLSKFHMLGMGTGMMKVMMKENRMLSVEEMIAACKSLGVKIFACTTTMALMGITKDDLIPEVDEFVGAATYLANASESKINLFV
jgi:peroxiredoxin family protein